LTSLNSQTTYLSKFLILSEEDKDTENMYTVMELGGKSLANYFHEKKKNIHNHDYFLVKNILQAAALAIKQLLHDSSNNFVVFKIKFYI